MAFISEKSARDAWDCLRAHYKGEEQLVGLPWKDNAPTAAEVAALFKRAAMATHPDRGGDPNDFVAVDRAKCILERYLAQPAPAAKVVQNKRPCGYCGGKGYVITSSGRPGATGLRRTCPQCHGSGDADFDAHNP